MSVIRYGYHGDDGCKFGEGHTEGHWPVFRVNDVFGCGYIPSRREIFFTRNGELLGVGFIGVRPDPPLLPAVGFHSAGEAVRGNFGYSSNGFLYNGPGVVIGERVIAARLAALPATALAAAGPLVAAPGFRLRVARIVDTKHVRTRANGPDCSARWPNAAWQRRGGLSAPTSPSERALAGGSSDERAPASSGRSALARGWGGWLPSNGMIGAVVHAWDQPDSLDPARRPWGGCSTSDEDSCMVEDSGSDESSILDSSRSIYLLRIGDKYVPVGAVGLQFLGSALGESGGHSEQPRLHESNKTSMGKELPVGDAEIQFTPERAEHGRSGEQEEQKEELEENEEQKEEEGSTPADPAEGGNACEDEVPGTDHRGVSLGDDACNPLDSVTYGVQRRLAGDTAIQCASEMVFGAAYSWRSDRAAAASLCLRRSAWALLRLLVLGGCLEGGWARERRDVELEQARKRAAAFNANIRQQQPTTAASATDNSDASDTDDASTASAASGGVSAPAVSEVELPRTPSRASRRGTNGMAHSLLSPPLTPVSPVPVVRLTKTRSTYGTPTARSARHTRVLRSAAFGVIECELRMCAEALSGRTPATTRSSESTARGLMFDDAEDSSLPASLSPSKLVQSLEPLELEAACYEQLLFLASVRDDRLVCRHCSSRVVLSALFSLMLCGSPRLQRLVLLLLLAVLPSVPPTAPALHAAQVEAWATEGWRGGVWAVAAEATMTPDGAGRSDTDGCAILEVLFHIIGTVAGSCGIGDSSCLSGNG